MIPFTVFELPTYDIFSSEGTRKIGALVSIANKYLPTVSYTYTYCFRLPKIQVVWYEHDVHNFDKSLMFAPFRGYLSEGVGILGFGRLKIENVVRKYCEILSFGIIFSFSFYCLIFLPFRKYLSRAISKRRSSIFIIESVLKFFTMGENERTRIGVVYGLYCVNNV